MQHSVNNSTSKDEGFRTELYALEGRQENVHLEFLRQTYQDLFPNYDEHCQIYNLF